MSYSEVYIRKLNDSLQLFARWKQCCRIVPVLVVMWLARRQIQISELLSESFVGIAGEHFHRSHVGRHPVHSQLIRNERPISFTPELTPELASRLETWKQIQLAASGQGSTTVWDGTQVICSPSGQLGNRVRFLLSCFLFALITNRALFVQFKDGYYAAIEDLFKVPVAIEKADISSSAPGIFTGHFPGAEELVTCSNLTSSFSQFGTVQFSGSGAYYFAPHIWHNPYHHPLLEIMFPDARFAEKLTWWLLPPNTQVWDIVSRVFSEHLRDAEFLVGQQIRTNHPPAAESYISKREYTAYHDCAFEITPKYHHSFSKWFVAADSGPAIVEAYSSLNFNGTIFRWKPDEFVLSNSPVGVREALADVILLSICDELIISPWSSYGQMAATYHMKPSYLVSDFVYPKGYDYYNQLQVVQNCFKLVTTEYSARQYSELVSKTSCFKPDMAPSWWL